MQFKGSAIIELTDVNTGEQETYYEDNMVTNVFTDILSNYPFGIQYKENNIDTLIPFLHNGIDGVVLFGHKLINNPNNYYHLASNPVVGYSNSSTENGDNPLRGVINTSESKTLTETVNLSKWNATLNTGRTFVFDFSTDRANGVINSLALTSSTGGATMLGSSSYKDRDNIIKTIYETRNTNINSNTLTRSIIANIVSIDFDNNCAYSAFLTAANEITVFKIFIPQNQIGLYDNATGVPYRIIDCAVFKTNSFGSIYRTSNYFYGTFIRGAGNTIWGLQYEGNKTTSSSANPLLWVKIDLDKVWTKNKDTGATIVNTTKNNSWWEGSWTFGTNASGNTFTLGYLGQYYYSSSDYPQSGTNHVLIKTDDYPEYNGVSEAYLYIPGGSNASSVSNVYKISVPAVESIDNDSINWQNLITTITGYCSRSFSNMSSSSDYVFSTTINNIGNTVYFPHGYIGSKIDEVKENLDTGNFDAIEKINVIISSGNHTHSSGDSAYATYPGLYQAGKPNLYYGPYLIGFSCDNDPSALSYYVWLCMSYLVTINNLENPITKSPDKTMKITYTIKEIFDYSSSNSGS